MLKVGQRVRLRADVGYAECLHGAEGVVEAVRADGGASVAIANMRHPETDRPFAAAVYANPDLVEVIDAPAEDPVNRPAHYTAGGVEAIDAIAAALTPEEFRGYCKGSALAYVWRERHKGGVEDLKKARWYLNRLIGGES